MRLEQHGLPARDSAALPHLFAPAAQHGRASANHTQSQTDQGHRVIDRYSRLHADFYRGCRTKTILRNNAVSKGIDSNESSSGRVN
ncbi:MAG: hypothetical protein LBP52_00975, partial [Burkholderiaceae bacterium]|nr:hypothetical protein [Burkholderiaceae bacterium]